MFQINRSICFHFRTITGVFLGSVSDNDDNFLKFSSGEVGSVGVSARGACDISRGGST